MDTNNDFISQLITDIKNIRFNKKTFKAYNVSEVDQFLDDLIDSLENSTDALYEFKKIEYMINEKSFSQSFNGYNPKEVDEFLESIIQRTRNIS